MKFLHVEGDCYISTDYVVELYVDSQYVTYGDVSQVEYRIFAKTVTGDVKKMPGKYLSRQQADTDLIKIINKM